MKASFCFAKLWFWTALLALLGCDRAQYISGTPTSGKAGFLRVDFQSRYDPLSGNESTFRIRNLTPTTLSNVTLVLNDAWTSPLSKLRVGVASDSSPSFGNNNILGQGTVWVILSSDVQNYMKFENKDGQKLPKDTLLRRITVRHSQGQEEFQF